MTTPITLQSACGGGRYDHGPVAVGRGSENDLVVAHESLSRRHALVEHDGAHWVVRDLESANGTYVNGRKTSLARLRTGDTLRLGEVEFAVDAGAASRSKPGFRHAAALALLLAAGLWAAWPEAPAPRLSERGGRSAEPLAPPAGLTAGQALALAEARYRDGERSGASLAEARRMALWAAALGAPEARLEKLRAEIEARLDTRWRERVYAYRHARMLGDEAAAEAAMRALRETFPHDDPRGRELSRLERR